MTEEEYFIIKKRKKEARRRRRRKVFIQRLVLFVLCLGMVFGITAMIIWNVREGKKSLMQEKVKNGSVSALSDAAQGSQAGNEGFTEAEKESAHPLLLQTDARWAGKTYGNSTVAVSGCAPTCISMVLLAFDHDSTATPDQVAKYSAENNYYVEGSGTKWTFISEGSRHFGLIADEVPLNEAMMKNKIKEGSMLILALGPGDFTEEGHFIVVYDYSEEGFLVNDPNSVENSSVPWDYDRIEGQIRNIWSVVPDEN